MRCVCLVVGACVVGVGSAGGVSSSSSGGSSGGSCCVSVVVIVVIVGIIVGVVVGVAVDLIEDGPLYRDSLTLTVTSSNGATITSGVVDGRQRAAGVAVSAGVVGWFGETQHRSSEGSVQQEAQDFLGVLLLEVHEDFL